MRDGSHNVETESLPGHAWSLSRRTFLGISLGGLLAACSSAPASTVTSDTSPTQVVLVPRSPISLSNAAQIQKLAAFDTGLGRARGVAWSPDGKTLAVGALGAVQLWDVINGRQLVSFHDPADQVYQLAYSPDGQLLAAGVGDNTVRIWDVRNRRLQRTLRGTDTVVFSVAWSARGDRLAVGNSDGAVQIWQRQTWSQLSKWNDPAKHGQFNAGRDPMAAYTVAWSPDDRRLAATRYDGYLRVWEADSGKLLQLLQTSNQPNGVSWSPDGQLLASASDDGTVQLWDTGNYKNIRTLDDQAYGGWAFAIPWSPAGRLMVCSRDAGTAQVWDTQAGKVLKVLDGQDSSLWAACWSFDGLRIATGSDDGIATLWGVR